MKVRIIIFISGWLFGAAGFWAFQRLNASRPSSGFIYPVTAHLYRMSIHQDKQAIFKDWVNWHSQEKEAINATMEREKMYAEAVFRDTVNDPGVIYWLAISGEGGKNYDISPLPADQKHKAYMKQILVKGSGSVLKTEFLMLPPFAESSIGIHQLQEK